MQRCLSVNKIVPSSTKLPMAIIIIPLTVLQGVDNPLANPTTPIEDKPIMGVRYKELGQNSSVHTDKARCWCSTRHLFIHCIISHREPQKREIIFLFQVDICSLWNSSTFYITLQPQIILLFRNATQDSPR